MRPLRPGCGTVSKAQLARLFFRASANGVVTRQPSLAPPASSSATERRESSDSRPATAHPPEPAPTTMKSKASVTCIFPDLSTLGGFPHQPFGLKARPSRYSGRYSGKYSGKRAPIGRDLTLRAVTKSKKAVPCPLSKAVSHWYIAPAPDGLSPRLPSQEALRTGRSARSS